jgi:aldose sugar dehydrogenase
MIISSGPAALKFFRSSEYGEEYNNDLFVGDYHKGYLYHFKLNQDRTSLAVNGHILDKTTCSLEELHDIILGKGFLGITDIEVRPDGYLYVVSQWGRSLWRIIPAGVSRGVAIKTRIIGSSSPPGK